MGVEEATECKEETRVVLTKPLSLDGESEVDKKAPNLIQRVLSLFKNVRPGSELTGMQLPPIFNIPKSQLQCFSEPVYCVKNDVLETCNRRKNPVDRLSAVIAWSISTKRPLNFGFAPFNPILGETHHVSRGTLNVLLEQVSHHPPVTALHATDDKENVELLWCQNPTPKFYGTSVETELRGKRQLKLHNHGETYEMVSSPKLLIKFLPVPGVDWIGKEIIQCHETGLEAEIYYGGKSFFGLRGSHRSVKGKIFKSSSMKLLFEIDGHWDRTVTMKDVDSGEVTVIYNAKDSISGLDTPVVKDHKGVWPSESAVVWSEVSKGILSRDWVKAKEAKRRIEEKQRENLRERQSSSGGHQTWVPQHFIVSINREGGWDCSPIEIKVPPAPIIVPL